MALNNINFGAANISANSNYYLFAGKVTPWANEAVPDSACTSIKELTYDTYDQIIFGKVVPKSNISLVVNRYDWITGTVYAQYDDQDVNLFSKKFFVVTSENGAYNVFKCLSNNGGMPSTSQPLLSQTSIDIEFFQTADGYQWKYLYTISAAAYNTFATANYIPLIPNANVAAFAANGGIESIVVTSGGRNYNSFISGYFAGIQVGSNSVNYDIQAGNSLGISISNTTNTFTFGETITQASTNATATFIGQTNSTFITTTNILGTFVANSSILGSVSNSAALPNSFRSTAVSSNTNFYTGCSLYIQSGKGAGQLKTITGYSVSGLARVVTVDSPFTVVPDFTSNYYIAPAVNIIGDGTGAQAISTINQTSNSVSSVTIINRGSNYSYANVSIQGNSGITSNTFTSANTRAIISPLGGHGANVVSELNAKNMCFSAAFANTENGKIPTDTNYRKIGIIADPLFSNVSITIANSSGGYQIGETLTQYSFAEDLNSLTRNYTNQFNYVIGNYINMNVANSTPFTANSIVTQSNTSGIVLTQNATTILVRTISGTFTNTALIYSGNTTANSAVTTITQGFTNTLFGFDGANNVFSYNANSFAQVFLNGKMLNSSSLLPSNTTFINYSVAANTISFNNYSFSNSDVVIVKEYTEVALLSNNKITAQGIITFANSTTINVTNATNYFINGATVTGMTTNTSATVTGTNQTDILDFRTKLNATYTTGSANVVIGDLMSQGNSAYGYVTSIDSLGGNTYSIGMTGVKGSFVAGSNSSPKYILSADTTKQLQINGITLPANIKYSGVIKYFENRVAVQRSNTQTEAVKIIISGT